MFFKEIYKHTRWYPYFSMQNRPLECKGVDAWLPIRLIRTNIGNIHFPDNMVRLWDTPLIYTPQFENRSAVEVRSRPTSLQSLDKKGLTGSITGHIVGRAALVFAILRFIGMQTFSLYLVQKFLNGPGSKLLKKSCMKKILARKNFFTKMAVFVDENDETGSKRLNFVRPVTRFGIFVARFDSFW